MAALCMQRTRLHSATKVALCEQGSTQRTRRHTTNKEPHDKQASTRRARYHTSKIAPVEQGSQVGRQAQLPVPCKTILESCGILWRFRLAYGNAHRPACPHARRKRNNFPAPGGCLAQGLNALSSGASFCGHLVVGCGKSGACLNCNLFRLVLLKSLGASFAAG
jgi:hypothetical protein